MKAVLLFLSAAITAVAVPGDDYKALTRGLPSLKMGGTAGGVALSGRMAFQLAVSTKCEVSAGAGEAVSTSFLAAPRRAGVGKDV